MKWLWIVLAIILFIFAICSLSLWHLLVVTDQMETTLEQMSQAVMQEEYSHLDTLIADFQEEWHQNEDIMVRYIHHEALDTVTGAAARLPALARYGLYGELAAEIERIQELLYHICQSEIPSFRNIF